MASLQSTFSDKIEDVVNRVATLESRPPIHSSTSNYNTANYYHHKHFLKLDIPSFDGYDPHGWIFKITQFFDYHETPEKERITIALFYLDGVALAWYQWMHCNGKIHSWSHFLQALEMRFAPTTYNDPRGKLLKLLQTSFVASYLSELEALVNRIVRLNSSFLLSYFLFGLKPELKQEFLTQQPTFSLQVVGLAKLHENKFYDLLHLSRPCLEGQHSAPTMSCAITLLPPQFSSDLSSQKQLPPLLPTLASRTRYKRLFSEEIAKHREKGLCYGCDQKWLKSHHCST